MKRFTTVAILLCMGLGMTSCMRQKYNYGMPRNDFNKPAGHKKFVKQHAPKEEKTMFFVTVK